MAEAQRLLSILARIEANTKGFDSKIAGVQKSLDTLTKGTKQAARNQKTFDQATEGAEKSARRATRSFNLMSKGLATLAAAAAAAATGLGPMAQAGGRVVTVMDAFGRTAAQGGAALNSMRAHTRGLIDDFKLMEFFNRAVTLGAVDTTEQFNKMAEGAIVLGRAMNTGPAFALESLALGIGRQSRLFLDNLGLIIKVEEAYRRYALSLGLANEQLTEAQQKEAFRIEAFRLIEEETRRLGGIVLNAGDAFVQFGVAVTNAVNDMKALVAQSDELKEFFNFWRVAVVQFSRGVSPTGQAEMLRIGLADERQLDILIRARDELRKLLSDRRIAAATQADLAPMEESFNRLKAAFPVLLRNFRLFGEAVREVSGEAALRGEAAGIGEMFERVFLKNINEPVESLQALGLAVEDVDLLLANGIETAAELFNVLGEIDQIKLAGVEFGRPGDLPLLLEAMSSRIEELRELARSAVDPANLEPAILTWKQLVEQQEASASALENLERQRALALTQKEIDEFNSQIETTLTQLGALRQEIERRVAADAGLQPFFRRLSVFPEVMDDLVRRTRSRYDDMVVGTERLRRELELRFGDIPKDFRAMLERMEDDAELTLFLDDITFQMDELDRKMAQLGRERAGAGAFRNLREEAQQRVRVLEKELSILDKQDVTYDAIAAALERARDNLQEIEDNSLTFIQRLGREFEALFQALGEGEIFSQALAGLISGGVSTGINFVIGALGQALFGEESDYVSALEENTDALKLLSRQGTTEAERTIEAIQNTAGAIAFHADTLERLTDELAEAVFTERLRFARQRLDVADVEDPADRFFALLKAFITSGIPKWFARQIVGLTPETIGDFATDFFDRIAAGEIDPRTFGAIPFEDIIDFIADLEDLGDAAAEAASELRSVTRNVPTGFKVALARFNAASGETVNPFTGVPVGGAPPSPGPVDGAGDTNISRQEINIESLNVFADDPDEMFRQVEQAARRQARRGGTSDLRIATAGGAARGGV